MAYYRRNTRALIRLPTSYAPPFYDGVSPGWHHISSCTPPPTACFAAAFAEESPKTEKTARVETETVQVNAKNSAAHLRRRDRGDREGPHHQNPTNKQTT
eukprot:7634224-Pyramimonas_sp.AAC.2